MRYQTSRGTSTSRQRSAWCTSSTFRTACWTLRRADTAIYLCTLVPGYEPRQPSMCHLVSQFSDLMNYIPAGPEGFDRSLAWPLLIAGSESVAASPFRAMFDERCKRLGEAAEFGSFGRVRGLLTDVWEATDSANARGEFQGVRWRDVMQQKKWDYLLI